MKDFMQYLPLFLPVAIVEIGLAIAALIHVLRHKHYKFGNRVFWVVVVLFLEFIGPILYFTIGRGDD
ncbi:PLDc N-terminal domain-containing protein [Clostridium oryzae]|uniref:Negative regulatory protein YxlE n=1 Tax=Clostridium oryzae TaxID=1450648 RepID=A0A1V4IZ14_9CLOT|nr:PLDc N-terminal domain-containing protein [Clostridium oryzae]OPJ64637.1 negative regulatory protein YxlE [Clostridium oryzae]